MIKITEPNVKDHLNAYLKILPTNNEEIMTSILNIFIHSAVHHKVKEFYDYKQQIQNLNFTTTKKIIVN